MFVATSVKKSLKNQDTGIDITVPAVLEVEAPLGGKSIEYDISIFTNLPNYKSNLQKDCDVVHFSVQKAYREVEDFYNKVSKKLQNVELPCLPKGRSTAKCSPEEKRVSLDNFMKYISTNKEICHSTLFQQFIGMNRLKQQKLVTSAPKTETSDPIITQDNTDSSISLQNGNSKNVISSEKIDPISTSDVTSNANNISELFPKMRVRKSSKSDQLEDQETVPINTSQTENERTVSPEDLDLFEEVKQIKEVKNKETQLLDSERKLHQALFDPPEDDTDLFRINSPTPSKAGTKVSEESASPYNDQKFMKPENPVTNRMKGFNLYQTSSFSEKGKTKDVDCNDDSSLEIDFKPKKLGISLFQEQDLGLCITKEDEELFYIPKGEGKKSKVNPFLSPTSDFAEDDVEESLEELTTLDEPSTFLLPKLKEVEKVPETHANKDAPSSEHLPKTPSGDELPKKPPVVPRKASLPKPSLPPKPTVPAKPKTAPKPSVKPKERPNQTQGKEVVTEKPSSSVQDMINIMQYIEQEQSLSAAEASLFD